jgi:hypothetical protein
MAMQKSSQDKVTKLIEEELKVSLLCEMIYASGAGIYA